MGGAFFIAMLVVMPLCLFLVPSEARDQGGNSALFALDKIPRR